MPVMPVTKKRPKRVGTLQPDKLGTLPTQNQQPLLEVSVQHDLSPGGSRTPPLLSVVRTATETPYGFFPDDRACAHPPWSHRLADSSLPLTPASLPRPRAAASPPPAAPNRPASRG